MVTVPEFLGARARCKVRRRIRTQKQCKNTLRPPAAHEMVDSGDPGRTRMARASALSAQDDEVSHCGRLKVGFMAIGAYR